MASVSIARGVDASDGPGAVSPDQWNELVEARRNYCCNVIVSDCRLIIQFASDAEEFGWLGFGSREHYLRDGLGLDPDSVTWAERGLEIVGVEKPVSFDDAQSIGKRGAPVGNSNAVPVWCRNDEQIKPDNIRIDSFGTSKSYTVARLDRDRPDLADRVRAGNLSANRAAIEAGFRRERTPLDSLRAAWRKASDDQRRTFLDEVTAS